MRLHLPRWSCAKIYQRLGAKLVRLSTVAAPGLGGTRSCSYSQMAIHRAAVSLPKEFRWESDQYGASDSGRVRRCSTKARCKSNTGIPRPVRDSTTILRFRLQKPAGPCASDAVAVRPGKVLSTACYFPNLILMNFSHRCHIRMERLILFTRYPYSHICQKICRDHGCVNYTEYCAQVRSC